MHSAVLLLSSATAEEEADETDLLSLSDYKTSKKHDTAARLFSKSEKINNLLTANSLPSV